MRKPAGKICAPIAIGGVGGSGTRLAAEILNELGFYIGTSLNSALDNLWFTILFKRPRWYSEPPPHSELCRAIILFRRAMIEGLSANVTQSEAALIRALAEEGESFLRPTGARREDGEHLIGSVGYDRSRYIGWGWKEPNTHVFLEALCRELEGLKYIHVIRHGLDMAFSTNRQQAMNWGRWFGLEEERTRKLDAGAMLDYWISANENAIRTGTTLLRERFFLLSYDDFLQTPYDEVTRLLGFLDIDGGARGETEVGGFVEAAREEAVWDAGEEQVFGDAASGSGKSGIQYQGSLKGAASPPTRSQIDDVNDKRGGQPDGNPPRPASAERGA